MARSSTRQASRRSFLKSSAVAAGVAASLTLEQSAHAGGSDRLRVGLIGCGGRGTGAATQAMKADRNVRLHAMGDAFEDQITNSVNRLRDDKEIAAQVDVAGERRFVGFDAYRRVIECCDVVLLATPPGFRPIHMRAAVEAGKHVFAEKPCAVDAPGVRSVLATAELARKRGVSLVAGLQLRYSDPHKEVVRRIHDGAIGQIQTIQANDFRGPIWTRPRQEGWSDMVYQMRNWYYFTWLSGDFNVEQHVHMLDLCAWTKGQYPVRAIGSGGQQTRILPEHGHIYDHFAIVYEFADGAKLFAQCRQFPRGCANDISVRVAGARGRAVVHSRPSITGAQEWRFGGKENVAVQTEHDNLFASIRNNRPINNGEYLAHSSLLAIMGRMAAYTGQAITWEMALNSKEDLSPPRYDWDAKLPTPPVARPGVTRFV
ncbi:MAG: Gfo/Idh/MocA family oxidoreductase [Gemmataceae bacterium]|nr:Gfo/Idh/MocA family oxidoreductase [Gemmataceae bacterium]